MFHIILICLTTLVASCTVTVSSNKMSSLKFDQQALIIFVQAGLRTHGYNIATISGIADYSTLAAAHSFLKARNLPTSHQIDKNLFEAIYNDKNFTKPMPYIEGAIRSCFRYGPENVVILATNLHTLTCTVKGRTQTSPQIIASATKFCQNSAKKAGVSEKLVKCDLIFDGQHLVGRHRLLQMLRTPSPDVPVILEAFDSKTQRTTQIDATLRTEAALFLFSSPLSDLSSPSIAKKPLQAKLLSGSKGKSVCTGTVIFETSGKVDFSMKCFGGKHHLRSKAVAVGVVPVNGQLLFTYEATGSSRGSQLRLLPPKNTIRFQ